MFKNASNEDEVQWKMTGKYDLTIWLNKIKMEDDLNSLVNRR